MLGVHLNIGAQRDSKTLYKILSIYWAVACELGFKVSEKKCKYDLKHFFGKI